RFIECACQECRDQLLRIEVGLRTEPPTHLRRNNPQSSLVPVQSFRESSADDMGDLGRGIECQVVESRIVDGETATRLDAQGRYAWAVKGVLHDNVRRCKSSIEPL